MISLQKLEEGRTLRRKDALLKIQCNLVEKMKYTTDVCFRETLSPQTIKHVKKIIDCVEKHRGSAPPMLKKRIRCLYDDLLFDDIDC